MGKRITEVKALGRETRSLLSDVASASGWSDVELIKLGEIAAVAGALAKLAGIEMLELESVALEVDPGVVEREDNSPIAVIRNHGPNPAGVAALYEVWGKTKSEKAARHLSDRFDRLLVQRRMEPRFIMGRRWCSEHDQFECIHPRDDYS
jgi:hypothetical protein